VDLTSRLSVTIGGRYNDASISLLDTIGNNPDLTSFHNYNRFQSGNRRDLQGQHKCHRLLPAIRRQTARRRARARLLIRTALA